MKQTYVPLLRDDSVMLRAIEPQDLEVMSLVENDTRMWDCIDTTVPYSTFMLKEYIRHTTCNFYEDKEVRLTIALPHGLAVGFIDLRNYEAKHQRAELGIVMMPEYQRQGLGKRALGLLVEYASQVLHMLMCRMLISLHSASSNHRASFIRPLCLSGLAAETGGVT